MEPIFFAAPSEFRQWLKDHHDQAQELWVGFYKKNANKPTILWPEAVKEAICYGWIDGIRKSVDEFSYKIRFTPRKPGSIWSAVNMKYANDLIHQGLMRPAGLKAFDARKEEKSAVYSYEQKNAIQLDDVYEQQFRANPQAWDFFQAQAAWYQRAAIWWVISAKKEETRLRRLNTLIQDSNQGRTVPQLTRRTKSD